MTATCHLFGRVPLYPASPPFCNFLHLHTAGNVFINEFHYDNNGTDINEAIEVVMPLGTDISKLSISLYNGNSPSAAAVYTTTSLSSGSVIFTIDNLWKLVTLRYSTNGIQNGPNDGIALVATCATGSQQVGL